MNWRGFRRGIEQVAEAKLPERTQGSEKSIWPSEKSFWPQVIQWAAGQPFNNVLLLLILFAIAWSARFAVTVAIPIHLKQIQEGYESLQKSHREERESALKTYDKWVDRIVEKK
jgi:hypothetical protein